MRFMLLFLGLLILISYDSSALTMKENTVLNQGNVNYIFENELNIESFNLVTNGIQINDDRLIFIPEGGKVNIYFYNWTATDKSIHIKSSVPQEITFKITINNLKQYLYDGNTYYIDKYQIVSESDTLYIVNLNDAEIKEYISNDVEKLNWYQKKIFEIEIMQNKDENGIIKGRNFAVTYLALILFFLSIIILWVIAWRLL